LYPNLNAEMARHNVTPKDIADALNVTLETARNKLYGRTKVSTQEAEIIRDAYFPGMTIDYLFSLKPIYLRDRWLLEQEEASVSKENVLLKVDKP